MCSRPMTYNVVSDQGWVNKLLGDKSRADGVLVSRMQIWLSDNPSHSWQHGGPVQLGVGIWIHITLLGED